LSKPISINRYINNAAVRPIWSAADDGFRFTENGVLYKIDPRKNAKEIDQRAPPVQPPFDPHKIPSPDGKFFLEQRNDNLFLGAVVGDKPESLTNDGTPDYSWAAAAYSTRSCPAIAGHFSLRPFPIFLAERHRRLTLSPSSAGSSSLRSPSFAGNPASSVKLARFR